MVHSKERKSLSTVESCAINLTESTDFAGVASKSALVCTY